MRASNFWQHKILMLKVFAFYLLSGAVQGQNVQTVNIESQTTLDRMDLVLLSKDVEEFLEAHYAKIDASSHTRISIRVKKLDPRLQLSHCDSPLTFDLRDGGATGGNVSVHTRCPGSKPWSIYVPAEAKITQPIIVAARNIERGNHLAVSDLNSEWRETSALNGTYVTNPNRLVGKYALRRIRSGEPIGLNSVTEPIAVKRGDAVVVEAQSGSIVVSAHGIALSNGKVGEQISVRNSQSERIVRIEITGPGRGRVIL